MRNWTTLITITAALVAFSLPAWADNHGEETAPTTCELDTECGDDSQCVMGSCHALGIYCKANEDCLETYQICSDDVHADDSDEAVAISTDDAAAEDMAVDTPGCGDNEPCEDGWTCVSDVCVQDEEEEEETAEPEETWGMCVLDASALPEDPACTALCELLAPCGGSEVSVGSGSSRGSEGGSAGVDDVPSGDGDDDGSTDEGDDDGSTDEASSDVDVLACETEEQCDGAPCVDGVCEFKGVEVEEPTGDGEPSAGNVDACKMICNYAAVLEVGAAELAAFNECLDTNAVADDACAALDACEEAGKSWGEAIEDGGVFDGLMDAEGADIGSSDTTMGINEAGNAEGVDDSDGSDQASSTGEANGTDDSDGAAGPTDPSAAEERATDGAGPAGTAEDDGGCNTAGSPTVPWLILMMLAAFVLMRRRRTA